MGVPMSSYCPLPKRLSAPQTLYPLLTIAAKKIHPFLGQNSCFPTGPERCKVARPGHGHGSPGPESFQRLWRRSSGFPPPPPPKQSSTERLHPDGNPIPFTEPCDWGQSLLAGYSLGQNTVFWAS